MNYSEVIDKMQKWCAYQDRSQQQVLQQLAKLAIFGEAASSVLAELIAEGFVDEERFARSYARGKFRIKKWGRIRIRQELRIKGVPENVIKLGLEEIDSSEYINVIRDFISKETFSQRSDYFKFKNKLYGKGFEPEIIEQVFKETTKIKINDIGFEE